MTVTMATALIAVREALEEPTERQWTNVELRRWINEGMRDVARRTRCLASRSDVVAVAGTQEYTMPTDVVAVHRVEYRATGNSQVYPLEYRDFESMDEVWWTHQSITQSTPAIWTQWGFPPSLKLVVYPKPSIGGTFKVFYYRLPVAINTNGSEDANTLEVPEGWEDAVYHYAEYRALRKDRDPRWQEAKARYEEVLGDLHDTAIRYSSQAGMVVSGGTSSFVPMWLWGG